MRYLWWQCGGFLYRNTLRVAHEARACGGNWRTGGEGRGGRGGRVSGIRVGTPEELSHQCPHTPLPRGSEVRRPKPTLCDRTNTLETSSSRYFLMGHTDLCLRSTGFVMWVRQVHRDGWEPDKEGEFCSSTRAHSACAHPAPFSHPQPRFSDRFGRHGRPELRFAA